MDARKDDLRYLHFSHNHLLDYTKLLPHGHAICSCCRRTILPGNYYYKCKSCRFYLHQVCFNMPKNASHPSDPHHNLTLQTVPSPSKVSIKCKACENPIKGFYYSCSKCIDYYHTLCLAAPLSMKTPSHRHALNIEFSPVYDFQCDLCDKPSYSGWLYHCNLCEFDAHLSCVLTHRGLPGQSAQEPPAVPMGLTKYSSVDQKRDELMELLTRGDNDNLPQDQSPLFSTEQDPTMPSFQLSEACFSIDFQRSLLGNDVEKDQQAARAAVPREEAIPEEKKISPNDDHHKQVIENPRISRSEKSRSLSNGDKFAPSAGIGAHIWTDLEQDTEKRNSKKARDQIVTSDQESSGCSKIFMCFFRSSSGSGGKPNQPRK